MFKNYFFTGLVQNGKNTAAVEISLTNAGVGAYKHDIYGDVITVCRAIGATSGYKIKNWRGILNTFLFYIPFFVPLKFLYI